MDAAKNGDEAPPARGDEEADTDPDPRGDEAGGVRGTGGSVVAVMACRVREMRIDVGIYREEGMCISLHGAMRWEMRCICICICL